MAEVIEVAQGVVSLIPSARGFGVATQKELVPQLATAGAKGGEAYSKGMKGRVASLAKGVFAPLAVAGGTIGVANFVGDALGEARESQKVGKLTEQIIRSTGGAAKITSDQVGKLSERISKKAGVDDEAVQSSANLLLTFKQVRNEAGKNNDVFNRATEAAQDLSAAGFGDAGSAAKMLGKALNDPLKGMSAMSRAGVTFTAAQKKQVESLVASGDTLQAQKIILKEVESQVGGSAAATATWGDKAGVSLGNLKEQVGTALLPVIDRVSKGFTQTVAPAISTFVTGMQEGTGAGGQFRDTVATVGERVRQIAGWLVEHRRLVAGVIIAYAGFRAVKVLIEGARRAHMAYQAVVRAGQAVHAAYKASTYSLAAAQKVYAATVNGGTGAVKARTVAEKAGMIAGKARLVVTKAITVAQRVLNAVMRANPLGLLVTGILLLVTGLVVLYKKHKGFRDFVNQVWAAIKDKALGVVSWFRSTAWPWMKTTLDRIGAAASRLWSQHMRPAFVKIGQIGRSVFGWIRNTGLPWVRSAMQKIGAVVAWLWTRIYKPYLGFIIGRVRSVFGWIKNTGVPWVTRAFSAVGTTVRTVWSRYVKPNLDRMKRGVEALKNAFSGAKKGIATAWSGLRDAVAKPIRAVLTFIDKKFISKVKQLLNAVGLKDLSVKVNYLTPGGKGYDRGGWTGPGSRLKPAGVVHADEFVVRKASRRPLEDANPGALDYMNRTGRWPGYAGGGLVSQLTDWVRSGIPGGTVTSGYRPGSITSSGNLSYHAQGKAVDIVPATMDTFRRVKSAFPNALEIIFSPANGAQVKNGAPYTYGGAVRADHWDHVHLAVSSMAGKVNSQVGGLLGKVLEKGKAALNGILDGAPRGFFPDIATGVLRKATGGIADRIADAFGATDEGGLSFSSNASGSNVDLGRQMAADRGWTGNQWLALKELWTRESNWNHLAKNPSSGAYGIPQSLPGSKMASSGRDWLTNPRTQVDWGLGYIDTRYDNPAAALAFHNRNNWYDGGGRVEPLLFDEGGMLPPGPNIVVNRTGKPEPLGNLDKHGVSGPIHATFYDRDDVLLGTIRGEIDDAFDHEARLARRGA